MSHRNILPSCSMRRILSFLTALTFFFVANTSVVMAFSMQSESQSMHHAGMSHHEMMEMEEDDCCEKMQRSPMDCDTSNHECCFAPFPATSTPSYHAPKKEKSEWFDIISNHSCFAVFVPETTLVSDGNRSHAPPGFEDPFQGEATYIALIWQIRNNN